MAAFALDLQRLQHRLLGTGAAGGRSGAPASRPPAQGRGWGYDKDELSRLYTGSDARARLVVPELHRRASTVLLFVRETQEQPNGVAEPYWFLGSVTLESASGERPMQIVWRLTQAMPGRRPQTSARGILLLISAPAEHRRAGAVGVVIGRVVGPFAFGSYALSRPSTKAWFAPPPGA